MPRGRARQDVAADEHGVGIAGPVGDHAARLANQQRARRDVPETEAELEEPVERARADVGEVEARRAGTAKILEALQGARS